MMLKWIAFAAILFTCLLFEPAAAQNTDTCLQVKLNKISFYKNSIQLTSIAKRQLDSCILVKAKYQRL